MSNNTHERRRILKQIDLWEMARCTGCDGTNAYSRELKCQCKAAKAIRKLGDEYSAISANARKERIQALISSVESEGLTTSIYHRLREEGYMKKEIAKISGLPRIHFDQWMRENGLVNRRDSEANAEVIRWLPIAEENGINEKAFRARIRRGVDFETAATLALLPLNERRRGVASQ